MNRIRPLPTIRRLACALAALASALLAAAAAAPAAFAKPIPPPGGGDATVPPPPAWFQRGHGLPPSLILCLACARYVW